MNVQSLSISVPTKKCPNDCKFCVSQMHPSLYCNRFEHFSDRAAAELQYMRRLAFARDNGCNTCILTGDGEPLSNQPHLERFAHLNWKLSSPFRWIEVQTSGIFLTNDMISFLRDAVGVSTISLSLSHFNSNVNAQINQSPEKLAIDIEETCARIKAAGFNLRLSLNLNSHLGTYGPSDLITYSKRLGADQITFRKLYVSTPRGEDWIEDHKECPQNDWINKHQYSDKAFVRLHSYIQEKGRMLERLPFGAIRFSIESMSTVIDDDCMNSKVEIKDASTAVKYLILRPDCHLYTKWDDKGSLLF